MNEDAGGDSLGARAALTRRAALASMATAALLLGLKIWAAILTGSVAMLGSLADTGLDLVASSVTLLGVHYSAQPADREHRFGHGKAEALAALFQVLVIALSAVAVAWRAGERLWTVQPTARPEFGIAVSGIAIGTTLALLAYQRFVLARTKSVAIQADHVHYQADLLLNIAVIAALALDHYAGLAWADPVFGVAIAAALVWGAWRAAASAIDQLMDHEWPEAKRARFLAVAARHPELAGIHDLRTRSSGTMDFVQFHVWVDPAMTVAHAHRVMDEVEHRLEQDFPDTEILIHVDPAGHRDRPGVLSVELAEETMS